MSCAHGRSHQVSLAIAHGIFEAIGCHCAQPAVKTKDEPFDPARGPKGGKSLSPETVFALYSHNRHDAYDVKKHMKCMGVKHKAYWRTDEVEREAYLVTWEIGHYSITRYVEL